MHIFTPPIAYTKPFSERSPLWSRITIPVPYTVTKLADGRYVRELEHDPDQPGIVRVYEGGKFHLVDDDEATLLIAAGYSLMPIPDDLETP